jgi:hypothetical protein
MHVNFLEYSKHHIFTERTGALKGTILELFLMNS